MNEESNENAAEPKLRKREVTEVERRTSIRATVVHEAIRREGEEELQRSSSALAWSGLAAGLSMGFSLIAEGLLRSGLPDEPWRPLVSKLGYSLGFLIVILGRQQLFTENTLTAVIPVLTRRSFAVFVRMLRLWAIVLAANLAGALVVAWVMSSTTAFGHDVRSSFAEIGREAAAYGFWTTMLRAIFAGWLIALVVWLLPASSGGSPFFIIVTLTYFVALGGFSHIIAGSVDVLYLVTSGAHTWTDYFGRFMVPTLIGNIIGGTSLVAVLNHAQVIAGERGQQDRQA